MFIGHFALATAAKPAAPQIPVGALMAASQAMDIVFVPLVAAGLESITMPGYGQATINAYYTHSIVGTLVIAGLVFAIGKAVWKSQRAAWTLALLSASHWLLDLIVHRPDMPILPGNAGNLPLLGFGLWNYPWASLTIEIILALVGLAIYFRWANQQSASNPRWYWGPAIIAVLFVLLIVSDITSMPSA
jgi:membrane-bound metal-dependent hydrolase YbcI (DUF457 family)